MFRAPILRQAAALVILTASLAIVPAGWALAAPIPGLFDTGVDGSGALLLAGQVDPHYALIASADPSYPGPAAVVANPIASPYWVGNSAQSQWIAPAMPQGFPSGGTPHPAGTYTYRLSFDLAGLDPATVHVSGACAMDNYGRIALNGVLVEPPINGYAPLTSFTLSSGFVAGVNTLDFIVTNLAAGGSNPTGVRVEGLGGSGDALVSAVDPGDGVPGRLHVLSCRPNPFNPRTTVRFDLAVGGAARLTVFDVCGHRVRTLLSETLAAGSHEAVWDGRDDSGRDVGSGTYLARLESRGLVAVARMGLVR